MVRVERLGLVALCSLMVGCPPSGPPSPPTMTWSVATQTVTIQGSKTTYGAWHNVPVNAGSATVDPTSNLQVWLFAAAPGGISSMTLTGTGNVICQARVSAASGSPVVQSPNSNLSLGTDNETVSPPVTPHLALLSFQRGDPVQDIAVIRCGADPTTVGGVIRYYDAWSGTLTFSGSANNTPTLSSGGSGQLVITLNPPAQ